MKTNKAYRIYHIEEEDEDGDNYIWIKKKKEKL